MEIKSLVVEMFGEPVDCRHCSQKATLRFIPAERRIVACYACPTGYVPRVMEYGEELDLPFFKAFLSKPGNQSVSDGDIRVATRYLWDLGLSQGQNDKVFRIAYWTQNYGKNRNTSPDRSALFLCGNCASLFTQPLNGKESLCENCRGH